MIEKRVIMNSLQLHVGSSIPGWGFLLILIASVLIGAGIGYVYDCMSVELHSSSMLIGGIISFAVAIVAIFFMANPPHEENVQLVEKEYGVNSAAFIPVKNNDDENYLRECNEFNTVVSSGYDGRYDYTYFTNKGKYDITMKIENGKMTMVDNHGIVKPNGKGIE